MKTIYTQIARTFLCFAFLTCLFGSCTVPDHYRVDSCLQISSMLAGCSGGYQLFVTINTTTNDPIGAVPGEGAPAVLNSEDLSSSGENCLYKGNKIEPFEGATSLLITKPQFQYQYKCVPKDK
jgi:hypothetical protein